MASIITYTTDLSLVSDEALTTATNRAWREASRCWGEYRRERQDSPIKAMLLTSADAAQEWWETLRDEARSRDSLVMSGTEVLTADRYEVQPDSRDLPDGGTSTLTPDEAGLPDSPRLHGDEPFVTSPWVRKATEKSLPAKAVR